ncbi:transposase [Frankia sp. Mgl5]|uniref:transposase n=1 Tax=Frankia sp. Mgl5 TaxID=2933793 RepID=UPI0034D3B523
MVGAQHPAVQRLQFFLSESVWDPEKVNTRRLELLRADPATAPHPGGVLVVDDSGDRKDGTATAHVGRQWLGRYGKTDSAMVTVSTLWADERVYHLVPRVSAQLGPVPPSAGGTPRCTAVLILAHALFPGTIIPKSPGVNRNGSTSQVACATGGLRLPVRARAGIDERGSCAQRPSRYRR